MARKKKARVQSRQADDTVIENGVAVSRMGRDRGSEHLWKEERLAVEDLIVEEIQAAARDKRARVARRRDILDRLRGSGGIDARLCDAGRSFQLDYYNAHLENYPPTNFEFKPSGSGDASPGERIRDARARVSQALAQAGGLKSPTGIALWQLVGQEVTLNKMANGDRRGMAMWEAHVKRALGMIADFYFPLPKKRC